MSHSTEPEIKPEDPKTCGHHHFAANCHVSRQEGKAADGGVRYAIDVRLNCKQCGTPFSIADMPPGHLLECFPRKEAVEEPKTSLN